MRWPSWKGWCSAWKRASCRSRNRSPPSSAASRWCARSGSGWPRSSSGSRCCSSPRPGSSCSARSRTTRSRRRGPRTLPGGARAPGRARARGALPARPHSSPAGDALQPARWRQAHPPGPGARGGRGVRRTGAPRPALRLCARDDPHLLARARRPARDGRRRPPARPADQPQGVGRGTRDPGRRRAPDRGVPGDGRRARRAPGAWPRRGRRGGGSGGRGRHGGWTGARPGRRGQPPEPPPRAGHPPPEDGRAPPQRGARGRAGRRRRRAHAAAADGVRRAPGARLPDRRRHPRRRGRPGCRRAHRSRARQGDVPGRARARGRPRCGGARARGGAGGAAPARRGRRPVTRPGAEVPAGAEVRLRAADSPYVSRGGEKLAGALDAFGLEVRDLVALDVGASTGGFTDCLLQRGARRVIALDVGYGQLAWKLRQDARVLVLERTNARALTPTMLPEAPDLAVVDVSFISLATLLPAVASVVRPGGTILALVKPQFEVGRGRVGKGGVVRDPAMRAEAVAGVRAAAERLGLAVRGEAEAVLPGPNGNREVFGWR